MKNISHQLEIPTILTVGKGTMLSIGNLLESHGFKNVVVFLGDGIRKLFGDKVIPSLQKLNVVAVHDFDDNNIDKIIDIAFSIPASTNVFVGIGGGRVLDVTKYVGFLTNTPVIVVPTSPSNDGFSSSGCSLMINGKRTSVAAKMPYGILLDIDVIKSTPEKFIYSGIGDLISKITALYDWEFEQSNLRARVNPFAVMIAKKAVNSLVRSRLTKIHEEIFLKELLDSLTMSGISMEIAGTSAPISGSEHLISHAMDKLLATPYLHGTQVGIATYIMSQVQCHRATRIRTFLSDTGFFEHVKTLRISSEIIAQAILMAPSIKPSRYTYIHVPEHQETAVRILKTDPILCDILV